MSYTSEQKISLVRKWAESSLGKADFSKEEGVDEKTLRKWSCKLIGDDLVDNWMRVHLRASSYP